MFDNETQSNANRTEGMSFGVSHYWKSYYVPIKGFIYCHLAESPSVYYGLTSGMPWAQTDILACP